MISPTKTPSETPSLAELLAARLGADQVMIGEADRAFMASDVYRAGGLPLAIVRPADVAALQAAVRLCNAAGVAMVPRGGGASYTDGYLHPPGGHVLFDLGALDAIVIDEANAEVTVGAGTTWAALRRALEPRGLRTPFVGPFSGIAATVGGSMSQNTVSHGSGVHGISAQSALSFDVVLASGELLTTSAAEATRFYGPDLTGLFTGDCGALGFKAAIRLPLIRAHPHFAALSFAFDSFAAYHAAMRAAQLERLDDTHFVLDRALSQGQIGRQEGIKARIAMAATIMRNTPRKLEGIKQLLRMGLAGANPLRSGEYMAHFIIEGFDPADAAGKARRLRQGVGKAVGLHGREIINSMPTFVRAMPFAPLFNILGPGGERWVPIHGIFRQADILPFHLALDALLAERGAAMARAGVWIGRMFSGVGSGGLLYELALYWPDDRTTFHRRILGEEYLAAQPPFADNPAARGLVDDLKQAIIALMQEHGAGHFQIGRAYPYRTRLCAPASGLLRAIKAQLDPQGLMNPGALGL